MLSSDKQSPPEMDTLECFGNRPNQVHTGAISANGAQSFGAWHLVPAGVTTGYRTSGLQRTPTRPICSSAGVDTRRAAVASDMTKPMYLLANLAVGGNWPGVPDASTHFPAQMKIDYIRAYSNDANAVAVAQQTVSTPDAGWVTKAAAAHSAPAVAGG